jgi:hypothetical protein
MLMCPPADSRVITKGFSDTRRRLAIAQRAAIPSLALHRRAQAEENAA